MWSTFPNHLSISANDSTVMNYHDYCYCYCYSDCCCPCLLSVDEAMSFVGDVDYDMDDDDGDGSGDDAMNEHDDVKNWAWKSWKMVSLWYSNWSLVADH